MANNNTLKYFYELCKIPHASGNEGEISKYIVDLMKENGLKTKVDKTGNVYVFTENATNKNKKPILLQAHLDMVPEKTADSKHNFATDPIQAYEEKGWIKAKQTTLGADDGIGVAMALSLLLDKKSNYNLEALFTIDEEQGLTGARNVEPKVLKSKYLINLDSEDDDEIVVGSAGGKRSEICYRTKREENDKIQYLLRIFDGVSGHSGVMIQESRSNVIVDAFVMLKTLSEKVEFNLVSAESGRADNVIPPYINIVLSIEDLGLFKKEFKTLFAEYKKAYEAFEPNLNYEIKKVAKPSFKPLSNACSQSFLNLMSLANNGINGYDFKTNMPTLSTNIGVIATTEKTINVSWLSRTSYDFFVEKLENKVKALAELTKSSYRCVSSYEGAAPLLQNDLADAVQSIAKEKFKHHMEIKSIHAGLEFGMIVKKYPGMVPVSIGPNVRGAHTPEEKVEIKSINLIYDILVQVIDKLSK